MKVLVEIFIFDFLCDLAAHVGVCKDDSHSCTILDVVGMIGKTCITYDVAFDGHECVVLDDVKEGRHECEFSS